MPSTGICLDVAIDHRIRQLLKPRPNTKVNSLYSNHVEKLQELRPFVHRRRDASHELLVTEELAKPLTQGGIAVALLRPANYHPFSSGVDVVVEKSPTLRALRDVFALIGLDLVQHITILDSLPFLRKMDQYSLFGDDEEYTRALNEHHEVFLDAVVAKRPDVVLCMWQTRDELQCNWSGRALGSIGVGEVFDDEKTTLCDRHGNLIETKRVNAFHPSHCMNYVCEYSQLRQLLILEIAHAWHLMDSSWQEEPWMTGLRNSWKKKKIHPEGFKTPLNELYAEAVTEIQNLLPELKSGHESSEKLYDKLTKANWTQHINDASLCLRAASKKLKKLSRNKDNVEFHHTISPQGDMVSRTMGLVMDLAMKLASPGVMMKPRMFQGSGFFSESFLEYLRHEKTQKRQCWFRSSALKRGLVDFLLELNDAFSDADAGGPIRLQMSLGKASDAFLTLANKMEGLLSTLAGYPEQEQPLEDEAEQEVNPDPDVASAELIQRLRDLGILH
ncbi:hypothetical protein N5P37_002860 [Trichoderma harzianum]|uniref:Uncharacterized protein n=1 Tax=Trichoderma harzianum CBS 226.95 TaxID=983964 RepID=A0A2T4ASJ3_TRIHA|nr:hypothetical protein M431DRAFT_130395 [Trichoderma harzianum CBS 226.95]KAK0763483.1 hypothetical protein N5P37_002860 [Trichoderma harzianum]PTB60035.1 hypothetical protein M431DRAFT_130395 [Trichoderma harzianum CBS 226.95]